MCLLKRVDRERVYSGPHVYKIWSRPSVPKHNLHYYKRFWFQGIPSSGYDLQGFPTELTPRVIPCCIVRILEGCRSGGGELTMWWADHNLTQWFNISVSAYRQLYLIADTDTANTKKCANMPIFPIPILLSTHPYCLDRAQQILDFPCLSCHACLHRSLWNAENWKTEVACCVQRWLYNLKN